MTISETVKAAVENSGQTQKTIAEATAVPQSVISEFLRTGRCSSKNLDAIASHFGIVAKKVEIDDISTVATISAWKQNQP